MYEVFLLSPWTTDAEGGNTQAVHELLVAGDSCEDVTGTSAAKLPMVPNLCVCRVVCRAATLTAIEADTRFEVLSAEAETTTEV